MMAIPYGGRRNVLCFIKCGENDVVCDLQCGSNVVQSNVLDEYRDALDDVVYFEMDGIYDMLSGAGSPIK